MNRWLCMWCLSLIILISAQAADPVPTAIESATAAEQRGDHAAAFTLWKQAALTDAPVAEAGGALQRAVLALQQLQRVGECDALVEAVVARAAGHADGWRLRIAASQVVLGLPHYGPMVAGTFQRGANGSSGVWVDASNRDRAWAIRLIRDALETMPDPQVQPLAAEACLLAAGILRWGDTFPQEADPLWTLTPIDALPDPEAQERRWGRWQNAVRGVALAADGTVPVHRIPASFAAATTDGERWRWLLDRAARGAPDRAALAVAAYWQSRLDVHTADAGMWGDPDWPADGPDPAAAVAALPDEATICRTGSGVRRLDLRGEQDFLSSLRALAAKQDATGTAAANVLAKSLENRCQLPRAAAIWAVHDQRRAQWMAAASGELLPQPPLPANRPLAVALRFRNAERASFTLRRVDRDRLMRDDEEALTDRKRENNRWDHMSLDRWAQRLHDDKTARYVGEQVAAWDQALVPAPGLRARSTAITVPWTKPGLYWIEATVGDSRSGTIVWLVDAVIATRQVDGRTLLFVADAVTGAGIAGATISGFGWGEDYNDGNRTTHSDRITATTDANGLAMVDLPTWKRKGQDYAYEYQWRYTAVAPDGRTGVHGFSHGGRQPYQDAPDTTTRTLLITDRPMYRPGNAIQIKGWLASATDAAPAQAGQSTHVVLRMPDGKEAWTTTTTTDVYGGFTASWTLPADASLGTWTLSSDYGSLPVRVEEYRKPEFEVTVNAPAEPIDLGAPASRNVAATLTARYLHGDPVTQGTAAWTITREQGLPDWLPSDEWDWLYGRGWWWYGCCRWDWDWGWGWWFPWRGDQWTQGQHRNARWGWWQPAAPEVVASGEAPIGADGSVALPLDVAALAGDRDDVQLRIAVTVTDRSRRAVDGSGTIVASRSPVRVVVRTERGWWRADDAITGELFGRTAAGTSVDGAVALTLERLAWDDRGTATPRAVWQGGARLDRGRSRFAIPAQPAGRYRLRCVRADGGSGTADLVVEGGRAEGGAFTLSADRALHRPGETAHLLAGGAGATVLLFDRASQGTYRAPRVLATAGGAVGADLALTGEDRPNRFVEAVTVRDGRVHTALVELRLPPYDRTLTVTVEPPKDPVRPGATVELPITVRDVDGKPVTGAVCAVAYDRAIDVLAGGSNVPEIKKHFWGWQRSHWPQWSQHDALRFPAFLAEGNPGTQRWVHGFYEFNQVAWNFAGYASGNEFLAVGGAVSTSSPTAAAAPIVMSGLAAADGAVGDRRAMAAKARRGEAGEDKDESGPAGQTGAAPEIRSDFRDTAAFEPSLVTGPDGRTRLRFTAPDDLTTWQVRVWVMSDRTRVGSATTEVVVTKDVLVRLATPRHLVDGDTTTFTANVHNRTDRADRIAVSLAVTGPVRVDGATTRTVEVPAHGEARLDWTAVATGIGTIACTIQATGSGGGDALVRSLPVVAPGGPVVAGTSVRMAAGVTATRIVLNVPEPRDEAATRLVIRWSPSLAGSLIEALPFLLDYPHGCTEQTLNRFVPAALAAATLRALKADLAGLAARPARPEDGTPAWVRERQTTAIIADPAELAKIVAAGDERLGRMQFSDGGWGWWGGDGEHSQPHTTATVVHGLRVARAAGAAIDNGRIARGVAWLRSWREQQEGYLADWAKVPRPIDAREHANDTDALVQWTLVEAGEAGGEAMQGFLMRDRGQMTPYGLALIGLSCHGRKDAAGAAELAKALDGWVEAADGHARLRAVGGPWRWCWMADPVETHVAWLRLLIRLDPKGERTAAAVRTLVADRRHATYWSSTRDTALAIEAVCEFLAASGEGAEAQEVTVLLDGQVLTTDRIAAGAILDPARLLVREGAVLTGGDHVIELRRTGGGVLYASARMEAVSRSRDVAASGSEIRATRTLTRLVPELGRLDGYRREPLAQPALVASGDLIEVRLDLTSPIQAEYLCIEDPRSAGCESAESRSGWVTGSPIPVFAEWRDRRSVLYVRDLPPGVSTVTYRLRAETPGAYSAPQARVWAMYAPDVQANTASGRVEIRDR